MFEAPVLSRRFASIQASIGEWLLMLQVVKQSAEGPPPRAHQRYEAPSCLKASLSASGKLELRHSAGIQWISPALTVVRPADA